MSDEPPISERTPVHATLARTVSLIIVIAGAAATATASVWSWKVSVESKLGGLDQRIGELPTKWELRQARDEIKGTLRKQFKAARIVCEKPRQCVLILEDEE